MHYNDNIHHNTISAFIIINISKYIVKSKNEKKSENFLLLFFNLNTPLSTFFRKISVAVLTPLLNSSKRSIARGDTRGGGIFKYFSNEYQ